MFETLGSIEDSGSDLLASPLQGHSHLPVSFILAYFYFNERSHVARVGLELLVLLPPRP